MAEKKSDRVRSQSKNKSRIGSDDEPSIQVNIKPGKFKHEWKKELKNGLKNEFKDGCCSRNTHCHSGNAVYGLGFLGAAIYFISGATGLWMGVLGFLKALVWPVFLVYGLLKFLGL